MCRKTLILCTLVLLLSLSCEKKEKPDDKLVEALESELEPLSENPLEWSDDELTWLDPVAQQNNMIGLGEATHGTSEFFKAKHRLFKYLVENHNFKVFAFEADFGESFLINEAVQRGDASAIDNLMKTKMHFWTWKTEEVRDLLTWMCNYNSGKADAEKVQYVGFDCQFNTFNPGLVKDYLTGTGASFYSFAEEILDEATRATKEGFTTYSEDSFNNYLKRITALQDTLAANKIKLIAQSSEKKYQLYERILKIVRQTSIVTRNSKSGSYIHRDPYMAENAAWMLDYFDGKKIVLWAHNGHVANMNGTMGYNLREIIPNANQTKFNVKYAIIGFLFSSGSFTAVGMEGNQYTGLKQHVIDKEPLGNSINFKMHQCSKTVFAVKISDLRRYPDWNDAFLNGMKYFHMGAVFNNMPENYYSGFSPDFYDYIIYFDKSTASIILE